MRAFLEADKQLIAADHKMAYDTIINVVANGRGGLFLLDAPGGTGNRFLISLPLA